MPVIITPREEWGALPPKSWEPLNLPVKSVILFPETRTRVCKTKKQCIRRMKKIQRHHMEYRDLPDIKFNFLVGLDGRVYEGTGWHMRGHDTHASDYKELDDFISICYIGDFADWDAPQDSIATAEMLVEYGLKQGYIDPMYQQLFHPDMYLIHEMPRPGQFKYRSLKDEYKEGFRHIKERPGQFKYTSLKDEYKESFRHIRG